MDKIRLAIADDSLQLQKVLITVFEAERDFKIVLRANNGQDLLAKLKVVTPLPDIILMDIQMPKMDGIDASKHILKHYPSIKIIVFSQFDSEPNVLKMYSLGVKSFIGKDDAMETLFNAIKIVHGGGGYVTDYALGIIQRNLFFNENNSNSLNLTEFERKLLIALSKGKSSTEIGFLLFRSPRTIEDRRVNLYKKFGVSSKEGLIKEATKMNFI